MGMCSARSVYACVSCAMETEMPGGRDTAGRVLLDVRESRVALGVSRVASIYETLPVPFPLPWLSRPPTMRMRALSTCRYVVSFRDTVAPGGH